MRWLQARHGRQGKALLLRLRVWTALMASFLPRLGSHHPPLGYTVHEMVRPRKVVGKAAGGDVPYVLRVEGVTCINHLTQERPSGEKPASHRVQPQQHTSDGAAPRPRGVLLPGLRGGQPQLPGHAELLLQAEGTAGDREHELRHRACAGVPHLPAPSLLAREDPEQALDVQIDG